MLILAEVVYRDFHVSLHAFGVQVIFFMKCGVRNKTAEKRLKMAIFKLVVPSYMLTTQYISFIYHLFEQYSIVRINDK